jgi:SAM-dependent methyltransferase
MLTIDLHDLELKPGDKVLDAGCGSGRHLRALAALSGLKIFGVDRNQKDLDEAVAALKEMPDRQTTDCILTCADITALPFPDEYFDCVICSEVLEHIPEHEKAIRELVRVLKPSGAIVISVPRYFSERICWLISSQYSNDEGGHIRIYKKKQLQKLLAASGLTCWKINYKHALHVPYWWLKCAVGIKNDKNVFVRLYHKFLVWDMFCKPKMVRILEEMLNPLIGKSIVFYLRKG